MGIHGNPSGNMSHITSSSGTEMVPNEQVIEHAMEHAMENAMEQAMEQTMEQTMEQSNKHLKSIEYLQNELYFDSELGYSVFFPKVDDIDVQACLKQQIYILQNAHTCGDEWHQVILAGDKASKCTDCEYDKMKFQGASMFLSCA